MALRSCIAAHNELTLVRRSIAEAREAGNVAERHH
jgi:hypothetical protein